jgi:hypothetical protein
MLMYVVYLYIPYIYHLRRCGSNDKPKAMSVTKINIVLFSLIEHLEEIDDSRTWAEYMINSKYLFASKIYEVLKK